MRPSNLGRLCAVLVTLSSAGGCHSEPPVRSTLPAPDPSLHPKALDSVEQLEQQPPGPYAVPAYVLSKGTTTLVLSTPTPIAGQAVGPTATIESGGWGLEAFEVGTHYRFTVRVDAPKGGGRPSLVLIGALPDN